ncbi:MAG TPA: SDR family oxidoreductase [Polyangiaceae bacterium]|nr:SDR family oxidoreductase [Polyangiaceae bacterium]
MANVLIVGANRGIGLAMAGQLAARDDHVIATCRTPSPELRALGVEIVPGIETTSADSIASLARSVADRELDLVVFAAAILERMDLANLDVESIRRQLEVNAVAPLRIAAALVPSLREGSKLMFLTSRMGSIEDNSSGGHYGYRMSKAALNMAARSLARDLAPRKITVGLLHPGFVRTAMTGGRGEVTPEHAAAQLIERIDAFSLESSGEFFHANGQRLPW